MNRRPYSSRSKPLLTEPLPERYALWQHFRRIYWWFGFFEALTLTQIASKSNSCPKVDISLYIFLGVKIVINKPNYLFGTQNRMFFPIWGFTGRPYSKSKRRECFWPIFESQEYTIYICIIYNIYLKRRSPFYWRYQFFFQDETLSSSIAETSKCECPMISFKKYTNIIYKWSQLNPIVALLSDALQSSFFRSIFVNILRDYSEK